MERRINVDDRCDRWRWVCPHGHRSWEPTNGHFWCKQCARATDVAGVFHELHDKRSGETVEREAIVLETAAGPYRELKSD